MKHSENDVRHLMRKLGVDYYTALQLLQETNSISEALELGKKLLGGK